MKRFVLASGSPRRQEILKQLGLEFQVMESDIEEVFPEGALPGEYAASIALEKIRNVLKRIRFPAVVVGADTIVELDGEIMGKPSDDRQAFEMLSKLAGKEHCVITGIAVSDNTNGVELVDYQTTRVRMKSISPDRIRRYVETGEPLDKAGAYAIQGRASLFIDSINGCYFNVVGLPVAKLDCMLRSINLDLLL
jgi:septum formation protein